MSKLNSNYTKLQAGYLFPEIARRVKQFQQNHPEAKIIKMGIGDTVLPIPKIITEAMSARAKGLSRTAEYSGYGDSEGELELRQAICSYYQEIEASIDTQEVFVSDGAKSDTSNIQTIFSQDSIVAVQDPVYPVYVDSTVILGRSSEAGKDGRYGKIVYLDSSSQTGFLPEIPDTQVDIIYLCFPNNPTGAVATKEALTRWVNYARKQKAVIIFDAAYSWFISKDDIPRSIYQIEGAKECAIEIQSFSKFAGFTGVRLGWTIVPKNLTIENAELGQVNQIWQRRQNTFFNAASNIAQAGGTAALSMEGRQECQKIIDYYMQNAKLIYNSLTQAGLKCYGGINAPYVWVKAPTSSSWDMFDLLLQKAKVVCTPGAGFGNCGEGYVRFSSFGLRENIQEGLERVIKVLQ